ncbi:MAG: DUF536 domain-containing protein [Acetilactobacillus jinshanensis]
MDLTIKQLASRLHISRPTVEVRMNHIPNFREKYTRKQGNKIMVNDVGCKLIAKSKTAPHHQVSEHRDREMVLKVLHNQALEQSNMIKNQDQTIKKLTKLLDQQQQLQLSTETENKTLKRRVKKLTHVSTKDTKDNVLAFNNQNLSSIGKITKPKEKKMRHHKFWRRFFGK